MNVEQSQKVHANQKDEVFYRVGDKSKKNHTEKTASPPENPPVNPLDKKIVQLMLDNSQITYDELAKMIGKHRDTIREHIGKLQKNGIITRIGPDKGGYWQVNV